MSKYLIEGGNKLNGIISLSGNKNSTFPCIAAAILTEQEVTLTNIPKIRDVDVMVDILKRLGIKVVSEGNTLLINAQEINSSELPQELTTKLRGSIVLAGALLGRLKKVTFFHPGGDVIGKRSINLHLEGFAKLGFGVNVQDQKYSVKKKSDYKDEASVYFDIPTVTGSENIILASVLRNGRTIIKNCAQEPHIVDLCQMLNKMGADIKGVGSSLLEINGVDKLHGTEYSICPDYLEFGTYAIAGALTHGMIEFKDIKRLEVEPITYILEKMGLEFEKKDDNLKVFSKKIQNTPRVIATPWPGFPTDLMSVLIVLATQASGVSLLHDWLYESRMFFVDKLISMGAQITIADPHRVLVYGPSKLYGRDLETPDIRAGMALVLAGLIAKGQSTINRAELIERGYEEVVGKLQSLGANIQQIS